MKRITMVIAGLGGRGHDIYGNYAMEHPDEVEIAAVADPRPERLELAQREWNIPAERCFATAEELFAQPQLADAAVIATQDRQHVAHAEAALKGGYHLLLEKPVAVDIEGCLEVLRLARRYQRHVVVCHVLRYTPFYNAIKRIIEDGRIGEVVTIQAMEQVGYWHQAHSFVRGNWRNSGTSSSMILQKCCHDMDILLYLLGNTTCQYISSFGGLSVFRKEHYEPDTMAPMCIDCPQQESCAYSAPRLYGGGKIKSVVFDLSSVDKVRENLGSSPYGRCVYHCNNNVADHQSTAIRFTNGVTATFHLSAFTAKVNRSLKVMCEFGEIRAIEKPYLIETTDFRTDETNVVELDIRERGHGGADKAFVRDFMESYLHGVPFNSTLKQSVESHAMALLAEESRKENGTPQCVSDWMQRL